MSPLDAVVLAARQHHPARRPVVPLPRLVHVAVLRLDRIADPVGDVRAGAVREAEIPRRRERLDGRVRAALEVLVREHPREQVDRLDAGEDASACALDLGQLVGEEQEQRLDDHVGALQDLDRRPVAGERRLADRPDADLAAARRRGVREPQVDRPRAESLRRCEERVHVLGALLALREHDEALVVPQLAEAEHPLAEVGEHRLAERLRSHRELRFFESL
jgi:hypothetical protein